MKTNNFKTFSAAQSRPPFTRYSKWQYIVIFISIIFLLINALPNIFQEQTTLVVSGKSEEIEMVSASELRSLLSVKGFAVDTIHSNKDASRILLNSDRQSSVAQQYLAQALGEGYSVESIVEDTTPEWLKKLGAKPIKLGLDLSGGVLFILNVDSEQAFSERISFIEQSIKSSLRKHKVRGVRVTTNNHGTITLHHSPQVRLFDITSEIKKQFPFLVLNKTKENQTAIDYPEVERKKFHQEIMHQSLTVMRGRIDELGITEAVTQRQGADKIRIELPGVKDPEEARRIIGATASLDFYPVKSHGKKVFETPDGEKVFVEPIAIFSGKHIKDAHAGRDEMGIPLVNLVLDSQGGDKMLTFSSQNIGQPMATVFSEYYQNAQGETNKLNRVISVATIQTQLGSRFSITNLSSTQEAQELALLLRAGSLSAPITFVKQKVISATLGESNIDNGLAALALGVGFTLLFMALWYRRLGIVANCALLLNLICLLGLMSLLPGAVLTLPGIAGFVLTVGMAVDTNVLIFERIKEEKKRGRSLPLAVEYGYKNALTTIFDANITTLITAFILYSIGYGPVKGFAVTLGLGIITSMFTGVFISRALTNLFYVEFNGNSKRAGASS
ncbi:protein translocase subunit SecD [Aliikangiella coralliicola]|uniref:Protein translocase subunit SecD n=1 Tax=Aliikangiella coralliicola TaxID=2592383 RepID=A0A545U6F9_9GAMM|nr:protein translocase subunit SecD [Aliikangiella coralliicola]TQV85059.1 protein translocase subunit SecD [Aliikangiella coralliicola]